jgi:hypothetical protein
MPSIFRPISTLHIVRQGGLAGLCQVICVVVMVSSLVGDSVVTGKLHSPLYIGDQLSVLDRSE